MESGLISLSKLFTERIFRIPDYQRGYAWGEKQIKDFWNDLDQLEKDKGHYAGVITLEEVSAEIYERWDDDLWLIEAKSYKPYFVVDGQQRLTTSIILLQSITECFTDDKRLNYTEKGEIRKKFLFDSRELGCAKTFVFGYERDNPSYEYLKSRILNSETSGRDLQAPTVYTTNLENAKAYFIELVSKLSHEELENLFQKLTQKFLFNIFTIESDVEVCVAFETMNNRGKPLSYLELLKNRLIYLSTKIIDEEAEKIALRRTINNSWKSVYHSLGRNPDEPLNDDEFLAVHYVAHFKGYPEVSPEQAYRRSNSFPAKDLLENRFNVKRLNKSNGDQLTLKEIHNYAISLQSSVEIWYSLHNPDISPFEAKTKIWLGRLKRLGWMGSGEFILTFFQNCENETKRIRLLVALEKYLFLIELFSRRAIYGYGRSPKFIHEYVKDYLEGKINSDNVIKLIEDTALSFNSDEDLKRALVADFGKDGFYSWASLRYFLYEYNDSLAQESKSEHEKLSWRELRKDWDQGRNTSDFVSVEHIFPKNAYDTYWKSRFNGFDQKQRAQLRNSLGNLLPLSKPKNSSLGNRPFQEKIAVPDGRPIGYRYGCYAENEVAGYSDWDPSSIKKRGLKMVEFLEKRWGLKFKNQKEMIEFLGLSFIP